ncbi:Hypothetical protein SRM_00711 [Salinibacter ruber M8]|uniref:Uncharacterized protein n=1 Tax=Salinibacter ruber (strain M8) TaxID=761659 RepID=D5H6H7_SALRM|nr:Hypothetical protein SRM_00711 [Salinibacter ruber M8]
MNNNGITYIFIIHIFFYQIHIGSIAYKMKLDVFIFEAFSDM